jgi:hypothetical protein
MEGLFEAGSNGRRPWRIRLVEEGTGREGRAVRPSRGSHVGRHGQSVGFEGVSRVASFLDLNSQMGQPIEG